jgi:hypothetical protein
LLVSICNEARGDVSRPLSPSCPLAGDSVHAHRNSKTGVQLNKKTKLTLLTSFFCMLFFTGLTFYSFCSPWISPWVKSLRGQSALILLFVLVGGIIIPFLVFISTYLREVFPISKNIAPLVYTIMLYGALLILLIGLSKGICK